MQFIPFRKSTDPFENVNIKTAPRVGDAARNLRGYKIKYFERAYVHWHVMQQRAEEYIGAY